MAAGFVNNHLQISWSAILDLDRCLEVLVRGVSFAGHRDPNAKTTFDGTILPLQEWDKLHHLYAASDSPSGHGYVDWPITLCLITGYCTGFLIISQPRYTQDVFRLAPLYNAIRICRWRAPARRHLGADRGISFRLAVGNRNCRRTPIKPDLKTVQ